MTPFGRFRIIPVLFRIIMTGLPEIYLLKQKNQKQPANCLGRYRPTRLLPGALRHCTSDADEFGLYYPAIRPQIICRQSMTGLSILMPEILKNSPQVAFGLRRHNRDT